jgi:hypothetical protein
MECGKWMMATPVGDTRESGNRLPEDLPNGLASECWAHVGCDFSPFRFQIRIHETQ